MSKLDEIQERIEALLQTHYPTNKQFGKVMLDIVGELKRIDAEQKSLGKVVRGLSDIHP